MKIAILVLTFATLSLESPSLRDQWSSFKVKHGKNYSTSVEDLYRRSVFIQNLKMIQKHNVKYKAGLVPYYMKLNKFADMTTIEFGALTRGFRKTGKLHNYMEFTYHPPIIAKVPVSIDWRKRGAVTRVKDQGNCGSCWAFSAIGSLEGQLFRKTGRLVSLSEQQLVDCSRRFQNNGCGGGLMTNSFQYINHAGGVMSEDSYPYQGVEGTCKFQRKRAVRGSAVKAYVIVKEGDVRTLKTAVAAAGPMTVGITAGNPGFVFYGGGVFDGSGCNVSELNHAVLIVGYGSEAGKEFWIIKNSWGKLWGEEGYMKLEKKDYQNICGIATVASYPII